tara:strand:+ start:217 stop:621 length:405 start_codon:yes stop_codon:yes gene_type:complete
MPPIMPPLVDRPWDQSSVWRCWGSWFSLMNLERSERFIKEEPRKPMEENRMNVNAEIEIDVADLASELVYESEFTSGVESVLLDVLGNYVGDEVDRYMSDHIEDVVIEALTARSDMFRRLVAQAVRDIADNSAY